MAPGCLQSAGQDQLILAAKLAWDKGAKVVILPTVPFGVNTGQADIKLDLNINPSTQLGMLKDLTAVLNAQGIHKLLILNGHGGNDFKQIVRELGLLYPKMFITTCNWYKSVNFKEHFTDAGDHAGEMETSVMMHIAPDLVLPLSEAGDGSERKFRIEAIREGWAWAERQWSKVTKDTGIGDPSQASAEKGEHYLDEVIRKTAHLFKELSKADINDLYE